MVQFCLKRMVQTRFSKWCSDKYGDGRVQTWNLLIFSSIFDLIPKKLDPFAVIVGSVYSPTLSHKIRPQTTAPYASTYVTRHDLSQNIPK